MIAALGQNDGATTGLQAGQYVVPEARFQHDVEYHVVALRVSGKRRQIMVGATGTSPTMKNISKSKVLALLLPNVPLGKQRRIVAELDALQGKVDAVKRLQAETATELDALLPALLDRAFKGGRRHDFLTILPRAIDLRDTYTYRIDITRMCVIPARARSSCVEFRIMTDDRKPDRSLSDELTFASVLRDSAAHHFEPEGVANIFISYARSDRALAQALADDLKAAGYVAWWDFHLNAGDDFHDTIRSMIAKASAVIVIWSEPALVSAWVRGEAEEAADHRSLISTTAPGFDPRRVPINFRVLQCEPVVNRDRLIAAIEQKHARRAKPRVS